MNMPQTDTNCTVNDPLPPMPALGWDGLNPDMDDRHRQLFLLDGSGRRPVLARMDNRNPFPPHFMARSNRDLGGRFPPFSLNSEDSY